MRGVDPGLVDEGGEDGGIDAAGDTADDLRPATSAPDALDEFVLEGGDA
jgi:hypothetical protein